MRVEYAYVSVIEINDDGMAKLHIEACEAPLERPIMETWFVVLMNGMIVVNAVNFQTPDDRNREAINEAILKEYMNKGEITSTQ